MRPLVAGLAILLIVLPAPAWGELPAADQIEEIEDVSLEALLERPVIAASRVEQRPGDSPMIVSVVHGDEIQRLNYRDVGSALATMRGVYSTNDRNYSYIGIRGFSIPGDYNTRLLLSIDDHPVSDPVYGQATSGAELGLPMAAVDRIELVRGSASSVYGSSAMLGAINVVTYTGATRPGLHVSATTTATAETYSDPAERPSVAFYGQELSATYGAVSRAGTDVFVAASYLRAPGLEAIYTPEFDGAAEMCVEAGEPQPCDGVVRGADAEHAGAAFATVRHGDFRVSALAASRGKRVPTAAFGTVIGDRDNHTVDTHVFVDGGYRKALGEFEVDTSLAWDFYDYSGTYVYYAPPEDGDPSYEAGRDVYPDAATAHWITGRGRVRWRREEVAPGVTDADAQIGAELVEVPTAAQIASNATRDDRELQGAVYAQGEARFATRFVGSAGVRADIRPESFGVNLSPRVGVLADAWRDARLRASWGAAFRAPNLYERFYYEYQPDYPALEPEHARTFEVSLEQYVGDNLRVIVAGYHQRLDNLIAIRELDTPGIEVGQSYVFENQGNATGRGVEVALEAKWHGTEIRANGGLQKTDDGTMELPNSPRTLAGVSLVTPVWGDRARFSIHSSVIGRRYSAGGETIPAAFDTDIAIQVPKVGGSELDLAAGVSNVFDQRTGAPGSEEHRQAMIPQDPRLVWVRLGVRLP